MSVKIRASVKFKDKGAAVLAKVKGMGDARMGVFAKDIVLQAKANAQGIPFAESTGDLASKIDHQRINVAHYQIKTYSGHASFIEFGTQFIAGKNPFLWPAYRAEKKKFFKEPWTK